MISRFSIHDTEPNWAAAYEFDIYLRGPSATPFEEDALIFATTPSQTVGPYFAIGLPWPEGPHAVAGRDPRGDQDHRDGVRRRRRSRCPTT